MRHRWFPGEEGEDGASGGEISRRVAAAMVQRGWTADPDGRAAHPWASYGVFERVAEADFVAQVAFRRTFSQDVDGQKTSGVNADMGVTYAPSNRLQWVLTGELSRDGVFKDVAKLAGFSAGIRYEEDDKAALDRAISRLINLVDANALSYAVEHASVEAMLEAWRPTMTELKEESSEEEQVASNVQRVPVLLAAAGRFDEARTALDHYLDVASRYPGDCSALALHCR